MKSERRKQTGKSRAKGQIARALARWENEGGAPKSPTQETRERAVLAEGEARILRCLGAAVIMQWNEFPRGVQRSLFEYAVSMGEPRETAELKGRIARFLHTYKNAKQR